MRLRFLLDRFQTRQGVRGVAFRPRGVGARNRWRSLRWRAVTVLGLVGLAVLAPAASAEHSVVELVTIGTVESSGALAISNDGSRVFLLSDESLVPEDTDSEVDIYEYSGGHQGLV